MCQEGVSELHINAVLEGVREVLRIAGMSNILQVRNFRVWVHDGHYIYPGGPLKEYMSIFWYIEMARKFAIQGQKFVENPRQGKQMCADTLLTLCANEPWQKSEPHYDVIVVNDDMFSGDTNFVIGLAGRGLGTVLSVCRFLHLDMESRFNCIVTETIHELGHVFGLLPKNRTQDVEESLGRHCSNRCVMRQGITVPDDWIDITDDRIACDPFCHRCAADLRAFFQ